VKGDRVIVIRCVLVDARWRWLLSQNYEAMAANVIERGAFADWARRLAPGSDSRRLG